MINGNTLISELRHSDEVEDELYHYGVKGMKWGVRRTAKQLGRAGGKSSSNKRLSDDQAHDRATKLALDLSKNMHNISEAQRSIKSSKYSQQAKRFETALNKLSKTLDNDPDIRELEQQRDKLKWGDRNYESERSRLTKEIRKIEKSRYSKLFEEKENARKAYVDLLINDRDYQDLRKQGEKFYKKYRTEIDNLAKQNKNFRESEWYQEELANRD